MHRRQRKSREAIFQACIELLSKKQFNQITVGEIIERADVGRATFYAHFETKDFLLKELCEELFCHVFDATEEGEHSHKHIFSCNAPSSVILHLFQHMQKDDNRILTLLSCDNNELFVRYFKENLKSLIEKQLHLFAEKKDKAIPEGYWINHIAATFVETVKWWVDTGRQESPEKLTEYFLAVV
jgi:AcrR family transcriptional regulator